LKLSANLHFLEELATFLHVATFFAKPRLLASFSVQADSEDEGRGLSSEFVTFPVKKCRLLGRVVISWGIRQSAYLSLNSPIEDGRLLTNSKYFKDGLNF